MTDSASETTTLATQHGNSTKMAERAHLLAQSHNYITDEIKSNLIKSDTPDGWRDLIT